MRVIKSLKDSFFAGLVLVLPLAVTIVIFRVVFNWALGLINPIVQGGRLAQYTANIELVAQLVTIGAILAAITLLGVVLQWNVGHRTFGEIGRVVDFIPLFRTVYGSVKQVASSFSAGSQTYESAVFVEYPREGTYAVGFVTGDAPTDLQDATGKRMYNVYLPSSPNPTAGKLAMVPEDQVHESELSVRQGIRLLMTTGTATSAEEMEELTAAPDGPEAGTAPDGDGPGRTEETRGDGDEADGE